MISNLRLHKWNELRFAKLAPAKGEQLNNNMNKIKNSIIIVIVLAGTIGFSCKTQEYSIVGKWCWSGVQNTPESVIECFEPKQTSVLVITKDYRGYEYNITLPHNTIDTTYVLNRITKSKLKGYEPNYKYGVKKVAFTIDKLDSNKLVLINRTYEGYKTFYKRCE